MVNYTREVVYTSLEKRRENEGGSVEGFFDFLGYDRIKGGCFLAWQVQLFLTFSIEHLISMVVSNTRS